MENKQTSPLCRKRAFSGVGRVEIEDLGDCFAGRVTIVVGIDVIQEFFVRAGTQISTVSAEIRL